MIANPTSAFNSSARLRPASTGVVPIGIERIRSVTPLALSWVTETTRDSRPKSIVMASIPGIRKSR